MAHYPVLLSWENSKKQSDVWALEMQPQAQKVKKKKKTGVNNNIKMVTVTKHDVAPKAKTSSTFNSLDLKKRIKKKKERKKKVRPIDGVHGNHIADQGETVQPGVKRTTSSSAPCCSLQTTRHQGVRKQQTVRRERVRKRSIMYEPAGVSCREYSQSCCSALSRRGDLAQTAGQTSAAFTHTHTHPEYTHTHTLFLF